MKETKQPRFRTQFNMGSPSLEPHSDELMTVPDQSLSISEIIARSQRGVPIPAMKKQPLFNEEYTLPDPKSLDMLELMQLKIDVQGEIDSYKRKIKTYTSEIQKRQTAERQQASKTNNETEKES